LSRWEDRGLANAYMETGAIRCDLCGKSIARKAWVVARDEGEKLFCEPDCERLYDDYWLPKYGSIKETDE
jgi:hypothetical protein